MPTLSVCLIVKNEERVLARCLRSVQKLADEIIVVDTGSEDRTVEIAESFGAKVFHFEWRDDFAAARNYAMDQASGDWILQIDADEEFYQPDIPHCRELLESEAEGAHLVIRSFFPSPETQTDESLPNPMQHPHSVNHFPRLVRNLPRIRYVGAIHEAFPQIKNLVISNLSIFHYGYAQTDDRHQRRMERNRKMTLKNIEEHPDDPISHYYAATTCLAANLNDEAEQHFKNMIPLADPESVREKHFYMMAHAHLATLAMLRADYESELKYAVEAARHDPHYLDPWLRIGEASFFLEKYDDSETAFIQYLDILDDLSKHTRPTKYTLYLTGEAHYAHFFLGRIAQLKGNLKEAKTHFEKAVSLKDTVWGPHYFLGLLYRELGDPRADTHLNRAREINPELELPDLQAPIPPPGNALLSALSTGQLHQQAYALARENRLPEARARLEQALEAEPESSGLCNDLGWVLFQLGESIQAEHLWLRALRLDPRNLAARRNLADFYFETRQLHAARNHYEALLERLGDEAEPALLDALADLYAEQGERARARELYTRILEKEDLPAVREKLEKTKT